MGEFSLPHILIVLVIVLVFFGPSRLPGLGKSLGEAIRGFKSGIGGDDANANKNPPQQAQAPQQIQHVPPASLQEPVATQTVTHVTTTQVDPNKTHNS